MQTDEPNKPAEAQSFLTDELGITLDEMQLRVLAAEMRDMKSQIRELETLCQDLFTTLCRASQHHGDECDRYARKAIRETLERARKSDALRRIKENITGVPN